MQTPITRRDFLGQACCAGVGTLGILSTLLNLRMANAALASDLPAGEDYRALVCLFMPGGIDSYNLLLPHGDSAAYASYAATRSSLALAADKILPLAPHLTDPFRYALHPKCGDYLGAAGLQSLYGQGNLAFLANVGTLVERLTKTQYKSASAKRPRGLFSHLDQQEQWQTSVANSREAIGWGGRAAELLHPGNQDARVAMGISAKGLNLWQAGKGGLVPYVISPSGSPKLTHYRLLSEEPIHEGFNITNAVQTAAIDNMHAQEYSNLLQNSFNQNFRDALETSSIFSGLFDAATLKTLFPGDTGYVSPPGLAGKDPADGLGQQLKAIVRTIKIRKDLGLRRQTFFVQTSDWDTHSNVLTTMEKSLEAVNRCLAAYWEALGELGLRNEVTLFSASDFGRTLTTNGSGTDHGWGGNAFVLGGSVNGGRVYGSYPDLALGSASIIDGRGVTLPTVAVDEYFAELALWLGVSPGKLDQVLPRIREFYTPSSTGPLGIMKA